MFKSIRMRGIAVIVVFALFLVLVSFPAIFAGWHLSMIYLDVADYESNQFQSSEVMTKAIAEELQFRLELASHPHPIIAFMASSVWIIWVPMYVLLGIFPVYVAVQLAYEIMSRLRKI